MKKKIILIIIVISLVSSLSFFLVFNESTNKEEIRDMVSSNYDIPKFEEGI